MTRLTLGFWHFRRFHPWTIATLPARKRIMITEDEARQIWREADAVCFDVDSTVIRDEGLDELAKHCGVGKEVQEWTKKAMGGNVSFRVALTERLNIIQPSRQQLENFIKQHPVLLSPGISELVTCLRNRGTAVHLVSGGFHSVIEPAAEQLGVPVENIFANRLKFYFHGEYAGFDENQPTSDSGGKRLVAKKLKEDYGYRKLVFVGDGATDMEAFPPADCFIGYGGNVVRDTVMENSPWFVRSFSELLEELNR